jgi:hypothetical protein
MPMRYSVIRLAALGGMLTMVTMPAHSQGSRVDSRILRCVVKISLPPIPGSSPNSFFGKPITGTAFLVSRAAASDSGPRLYLVTNKHMVSDWTLADGVAASYRPYIEGLFYPEVSGPAVTSRIPLTSPHADLLPGRLWQHPDPAVDVALVSLWDVPFPTAISPSSFDTSYLISFDTVPKWLIGLGDQVFALGYPQGITSVITSEPIGKSGFLATSPGTPFAIDIAMANRAGTVVPRRIAGAVMLVDGLITNGNSGGPIVLSTDLKLRRDPDTKQLQFATAQPQNWVIGIVSMSLGTSGLTLVYSSDFILAGVEAFSKEQSRRTG